MASRASSQARGLSAALAIAGCGPGGANSGAAAAASSEIRVASGVVLADEVLWALGDKARGRTVAVSALVDDPLYSAVPGRWPGTVARLGSNIEQLVALAPTSLILAPFTQGEYRAAAAERVNVVVLESFASFDDYGANVRAIGDAVGMRREANAIVESFERRRGQLVATRPAAESWPTCISYISGYVAARGTTFDDISATAGCQNLASARGLEGHAPLEVEQLLAWDPRVLVVQCPRSGCDDAMTELLAIPGMRGLGAVANARVVAIDARALTSIGAGMLDATDQLRAGLASLDAPAP